MESEEIKVMRKMAWERAKGELISILHTYYGDMETYNRTEEVIEKFIKIVEDEGIIE